MRVSEVVYERLFNTGNFENQKLGVRIILDPHESPHDVLTMARNEIEGIFENWEEDDELG